MDSTGDSDFVPEQDWVNAQDRALTWRLRASQDTHSLREAGRTKKDERWDGQRKEQVVGCDIQNRGKVNKITGERDFLRKIR